MRIFIRSNIRILPIKNPQIRKSAYYPRPAYSTFAKNQYTYQISYHHSLSAVNKIISKSYKKQKRSELHKNTSLLINLNFQTKHKHSTLSAALWRVLETVSIAEPLQNRQHVR